MGDSSRSLGMTDYDISYSDLIRSAPKLTRFALSPQAVELMRRGRKWSGEFPPWKLASPRVNRAGDFWGAISHFPSPAPVKPGSSNPAPLRGKGKSKNRLSPQAHHLHALYVQHS